LRRVIHGTAAILALCLITALFAVPEARAEKDYSIIPLPVYATSRNGGNEYGFMPVMLLKENEYIYGIFAPSAIYNENTGLNLTFRYLGYPSIDKHYAVYFNRSLGVDHEVTVEYWDDKFWDGRFQMFGRISYFRDSTYRFFGLGELSDEVDEANYSNVEFRPEGSLGYYINENMVITLRERFRWVTIRRGKLELLPYIKSDYPTLEGINGGAVLNSRLSFTYDTRDDTLYPGEGWYSNIYGEINAAFSNTRPYTRVGMDTRRYMNHFDKRFVTVIRGAFEVTGGRKVPFYEQSTLGGENSLRGYGRYRFTDDCFVLVNLEERIKLFRLHLYGVWSEWEAAPFVDVGRVFSTMRGDFFQDIKINPGIGFRAIVEPNIVGRVDIGYSDEGITAFVGLEFPF
jgi:outer membrane protein assembly factor BamA